MLNAPLGPLGPLCGTARHSCPVCTIWATGPWDVVASVVFALFVFVLTFSCCYFPFVQGRCAFASKVAHLRDPELRKLAEGLPLRAVKAKASSTTERYSRVFQKSDSVSCPFHLLNRYVSAANLDLSSSLPFFRSLHFHKVTSSYSLRSTGMSYTRIREIVLQAFAGLGYPKHLFGLHSLRAGGASAAANAGVSDRLFKRHGRWRTDRAKDGYIKDSLESLLSVSKSLHT